MGLEIQAREILDKIREDYPPDPRLESWRRHQMTRPEYAGGFIGPLPMPQTIASHSEGRPRTLALMTPPVTRGSTSKASRRRWKQSLDSSWWTRSPRNSWPRCASSRR
jgi:hypothetical protein